MSEKMPVIELIDERITDERLRREAFYNWLVENRFGEKEAARRIQAEAHIPCPACGGSGCVRKTLHGKAVSAEIRVHCELCEGVGGADGLKEEAEALRIRAILAGKSGPKVSVEDLEAEAERAQRQLEARDKIEVARLEREAEAKRVLAEAEALAKRIREGA